MNKQFGSRAKRIALAMSGLGVLTLAFGTVTFTAGPAFSQSKGEKRALEKQTSPGVGVRKTEVKWPPTAGNCSTVDEDSTAKELPTEPKRVASYCYNNYKDRSDCQVACAKSFEGLSVAPPDSIATGTCKLDDAEKAFFDNNKSFSSIKSNLKAAVEGTTPATKTSEGGSIPVTKFGPSDNTLAQTHNRDGANTQLRKMQSEFLGNLSSWTTLSNKECFDCNVLQRWAVLKGAANLIKYSHTQWDTKDGIKVGVNSDNELVWTEDDEDSTPDENGSMRSITKRNYPGKSKVLSEVTDQWLAALDPAYIERLKSAICSLAKPSKQNADAYKVSTKYFDYAKNMQILVNEAFTPKEKKNTAGVFEGYEDPIFALADKSQKSVLSEEAKKSYTAMKANNDSNPNKCNPKDWELRIYTPERTGDDKTLTNLPDWCKDR